MSDQNSTTPTTTVPTPDAGTVTQAAPVTEPTTPQPFAVFQDAKSFNTRLSREARKMMNEQAKAAGFDDWQHMQDAVSALRQAPTTPATPGISQEALGAAQTLPVAQSTTDDAKRLRMALSVASELSLPTTLVERLVGETAEEMTADANRLLALFQQPQRGPGVPSAPKQNQPVTFTRAQLRDAKFVREHKDAILQASREGRIVDS